ncbi:hypothetical protein HN695_03635 [Candidatus Woesearchaeota archaeon]|jgi:hypothetical protein|nr:hypothetical protein [Candidatus Woesearchaeota archaeon]MBT5272240.1 hypothetical protein [Candidatus Woesearchaeota archaeon]MBT6041167.1 hypothetical protein [Candidatus Woesearchaeota archaeon]MBT6336512.1 hypothetical protein [Candidatus Woesearchaeota archaeon]MBT7927402.1 hypothetical protein [Candidatus Woesearchaeota archaeon]
MPGIKTPNVRLQKDTYNELMFFVKILVEKDSSIPYKGSSIQEVVNDFVRKGLQDYRVKQRQERFLSLEF